LSYQGTLANSLIFYHLHLAEASRGKTPGKFEYLNSKQYRMLKTRIMQTIFEI